MLLCRLSHSSSLPLNSILVRGGERMQPSMTSFALCMKPIQIIPWFHKCVMYTKPQKTDFISLVIVGIILEHVKNDRKVKTLNGFFSVSDFLKIITGKIRNRSLYPYFFL